MKIGSKHLNLGRGQLQPLRIVLKVSTSMTSELKSQKWFEMADVRKKRLEDLVWIPILSIHKLEESGESGSEGYREEFFGLGALLVPLSRRKEAEELEWMDVGISHTHKGWLQGDHYKPANAFYHYGGEKFGEHLALQQHFNSVDNNDWHLGEDFVLTLGLKREGDVWLRPSEGYIEVARLLHTRDGSPQTLEVRATHLRDYLCARKMGLYATTYRSRTEIVSEAGHIDWKEGSAQEKAAGVDWEGRVMPIHEGGMPFGQEMAIFHMSRTDVDPEDDLPRMGDPTDENVHTESSTRDFEGRKLFRIMGELWRNEWIAPAEFSSIVGNDPEPETAHFITDLHGKQENSSTLVGGDGRWLWFKPEVVMALINRRGGSLQWYTRETGRMSCSPDHGVHFGVNGLGLINVYAKDIGLLPQWQQKIWVGFNVPPEGKVSKELLASQVESRPARSQAPEPFLGYGLDALGEVSARVYGKSFVRPHDKTDEILMQVHRFRATDSSGIYALAKDLARVTADAFDKEAMHAVVQPPKSENWGSLKSLEKVVATYVGEAKARYVMGPLFKIYELRLADAHLPGADAQAALRFLGAKENMPLVFQATAVLSACVTCLYTVCKIIDPTLFESNEEEG